MTRATLNTPERVTLLLSLVPYLLDRGPTPLDELAETFDVSPELLRTLVTFLGTAGVPGETRTYQHDDLFDLDWAALDEGEVSLIKAVAVDDTPRFSAAETSALMAGLHYLSGVLPDSDAELIVSTQRKLSRIQSVERSPISVNAGTDDPRLAQISRAIAEGTTIGFRYRNGRGGVTERSAEPLLLEQEGELWYLRAWCVLRDEERVFRVDRMSQLTAGTRPVTHQASAGVGPRPLFVPEEEHAAVVFRVAPEALARLTPYAATVLDPGNPVPGSRDRLDWALVQIQLAHLGTVPRVLALAPGRISVHAPESARAAARAWADRALAAYDE